MSVAGSMEEPNRMEIKLLGEWRPALVRVVTLSVAWNHQSRMACFRAYDHNRNAMAAGGQRCQLGRHCRVVAVRAGFRN